MQTVPGVVPRITSVGLLLRGEPDGSAPDLPVPSSPWTAGNAVRAGAAPGGRGAAQRLGRTASTGRREWTMRKRWTTSILLSVAMLIIAVLVIVFGSPARSAVRSITGPLAAAVTSVTHAVHLVSPGPASHPGSVSTVPSTSFTPTRAGARDVPHPIGTLLSAFATPTASLAGRHTAVHSRQSTSASASASASSFASASASGSASASASASPTASVASGLPAGAWNLKWNDEFDGSSLSSGRWATMDHSTFGDGNQQLECEMASNVAVGGGVLTLLAKREPSKVTCGSHDSRFPSGRSYTGATIETRGTAQFTYGYFEIRAKLPMTPGASKGLWPAFWLRPVDGGAGEIDVLETIGTPAGGQDQVHQTIHPAYGSSTPMQTNTADFPGGSLSAGYHTYGLDWEPGSISWYIDGKLLWTRTTTTTPWMSQVFARPYFMRLNFAVGGTWPGSPDSSTAFPASYGIDWVRVYQH